MKRLTLIAAAASAAFALTACTAADKAQEVPVTAQWIPIVANESVLPFGQGILASDFGENSGPGQGYVQYLEKNFNTYTVMPGLLTRPTAMAIYQNFLLVCQPHCIAAFDLENEVTEAAFVITFPEDEQYLNDIVLGSDGTLYVSSVQNDRLYMLRLPKKLDAASAADLKPEVFVTIPGPNGITVDNSFLYAASIAHDYKSVSADNVVYRIDLASREITRLTKRTGLYDGAALYGATLYVSDWQSQSIEAISLGDGTISTFFAQDGLTPADIAVDPRFGVLYIPDMLNHRILTISLKDGTLLDGLPKPLLEPVPYAR